MDSNTKLLHLRQLLAERFPGLHTHAKDLSTKAREAWPTGLEHFDTLLRGGLPKGAITEIVGKTANCGTASVIHALLRRAHETRQFIALIDGCDTFDPTAFDQGILSRLLWIRCHNTAEALKCSDILLRDRNLPLVILDLKMNPTKELGKISGTTWFRLQRVIQQTSIAFLVVTPRTMVSGAEIRLTLDGQFSLEDQGRDQNELIDALRPHLAHERKGIEHLRQTA